MAPNKAFCIVKVVSLLEAIGSIEAVEAIGSIGSIVSLLEAIGAIEAIVPRHLKYWVGVQRGQSYLMGSRCIFSLGWPPF